MQIVGQQANIVDDGLLMFFSVQKAPFQLMHTALAVVPIPLRAWLLRVRHLAFEKTDGGTCCVCCRTLKLLPECCNHDALCLLKRCAATSAGQLHLVSEYFWGVIGVQVSTFHAITALQKLLESAELQ